MQKQLSLQAAMEDLKLRNSDLNHKTQQSDYRLEQLRRQSTLEIDQLCEQIKHLIEVVGRLQAPSAPSTPGQGDYRSVDSEPQGAAPPDSTRRQDSPRQRQPTAERDDSLLQQHDQKASPIRHISQ